VELIITEKDNAARRIAEILSDGSADVERRNGVPVYRWGGRRCIGLSGHVVGVDFPPEYADWRDVQPVELVDAPVVKTDTQENIVAALRSLAREADRAVVATDYDREGELIGKEAYELVREETDIPIDRVRFSSITDREVTEAFRNPEELDFDLAAAGEARQIVDLIWGAALTRFLSLSAKQLGEDFISVGRVQSPTLKLIVDREREIEAFDPEDYWELFADLSKDADAFEAQYFYEGEDGTENERVRDESEAEAAYERLSDAEAATVESVRRRTRTDDPPAPFNTTQYIRAAGSLGYSAQRAMSIAEDLYTAGYVTYPRTDNTVYPDDLDARDLLERFADHPRFGDDAASLLDADVIEPTSGDEETTDHPPIHPTGEFPEGLSDDEWEVYDLIVRRFLATCADPATWAHLRVVATANGCSLKANGKRLLEEGYHAVSPYHSTSESHVPEVEEGEELAVADPRLEAKQTQPPRRRGQSRLIETMEDLGLGTKCLTGDTEVLIRADSGDVERREVSDLFRAERVLAADGDADVAATSGGPRTLSYDESTERISEVESTAVSKRLLDPDERIFRVETERGSFSVTGDHPLYVERNGHVTVVPVREVTRGDELLSSRPSVAVGEAPDDPPVAMTWTEFATDCDRSTKLYGTDCGDRLAERRKETGETQAEMADRLDGRRCHLSAYETGQRDVPAWILGEFGLRPDRIHGLNRDTTVENPFPLEWTPTLARVLGNLLGDGSIHVDENENVVDVGYRSTNRQLVDRFVADVESLFGVAPTVSERSGREDHHLTKCEVSLPAVIGRVLVDVLDSVSTDGTPEIPERVAPTFVGALFDDEGHVSRERKAFVSNTDHDLLASLREFLSGLGVETALAPGQHELHVRGRRNLERFFDRVPVAAGEKFHRALDGLRSYDVTQQKARLLELTSETPRTSDELATALDLTGGRVNDLVRSLREDGYLEKRVEGSNRSRGENRTVRYRAVGYDESIYARVLGRPASTTVTEIRERDYDGPVYDLSVADDTPNFAVGGGVIVHNSTRHNTLQKLYDRGYVEGDPPRPTKLAMGVVEAAERFADIVVSEEMTAQLEEDMTAIASGEATLDDVTDGSREILGRVFEDLHDSREEVGEHLRESLKADKVLGPCPECGSDLLVRRSRWGSYFVGCDGYPDCEYTLPLPNRGEPLVLDDTCEDHGLRAVKMLAGSDTFTHGCPRCRAEEAEEADDEVIGACPECGEGATSASGDESGETDTADAEGGELAIKTLRSGSRLVGCTRYPDCEYSLPLPRNGEIEVTDDYCDDHDLPGLVVHGGDDPWELGCPICNYAEYRERRAAREIRDLDGVGDKTAEKLAAAGIESLDDLRTAEADTVASEVQGVSADRVRDWQSQAEA